MKHNIGEELTSITTIDGRYKQKVLELSEFVSEFALIKLRLKIETSYLAALSKSKITRPLTNVEQGYLLDLASDFSLSNAIKVKKIEEDIVNDVRSLEIFTRKKLSKTSLKDILEFYHFGLTHRTV